MSTSIIVPLRKRGEQTRRSWPVKAGAKILANQHLDISTGYARPWPSTPALGLISGGMSIESQDNTGGGNGDLWVEAEAGEVLFPLGSFTASKAGDLAFGVDEETAQPTNGGGTLSPIGRVSEVVLTTDPRVLLSPVGEQPGVWIEVGDLDDGIHRSPIVITKIITEADLTGAGLTEAVNLGGVLPQGAKFRSADLSGLTAFSGGGASTATVAIGISGTPTAIRTATDVFTGASGFPKSGTAGAQGHHGADFGGAQIQALFTVTTSSTGTTGGLTVGSITITLVFDFPGA